MIRLLNTFLSIFFLPVCAFGAVINLAPGGSVNWANVQPGDTIQLAAGNYSGGFNVGKSGTASAPITIKGPDSGTAKWTKGWDLGANSNLVIDGQHAYGISIDLSGGNGGSGMLWGNTGNVSNLTIKYLEAIGTPKTTGVSTGNYGLNFCPYSFTRTNALIDHCRFYQWNETFRASKWSNFTIQHCEIRKTFDDNVDHADLIYSYPCNNVVWRWNAISESPVDGMFHEFGGANGMEFYGNTLFNSSNHFLSFKAPDSYGPLKVFNNTFVAKSASQYGWLSTNGTTLANGSIVKNNIMAYVSNDMPGATKSNNAYNYTTLNGYPWPSSEPGSFTYTGNPFVDAANGDFHLNATGAGLMKGKGVVISGNPDYALDADGNNRGTNAWDVGAFVAGGSPQPTPTPPQPTPSPSASPSASPSPSSTPTPPQPTPTPVAKFKVGDHVVTIQETNIRATPGGAMLGTQPAGIQGTIQAGPQDADLNGANVVWYQVVFSALPNGWCGDDNLDKFVAPSPTPPQPTPSPSASPSPTPGAPTYDKWTRDLNQNQTDWIKAHPPTSD